VILTSLRTNHLSEAGLRWYAGYLEALDARDMERLLSLVAEDASLQVNNQMQAYGRDAIATAVGAYWHGFRSSHHEPLCILGSDTDFAVEVLCHYTRLRGDVFTIPACSFKTRNAAGLMTSVRIFADISPLAQ
jgi:hypothetical protein